MDMSVDTAIDGEPLWRLKGAAALYAREVWPDRPGAELWAEEMIRSMPGAEREWLQGVVVAVDGKQRRLSALTYGRDRIAAGANRMIEDAVRSQRLALFNPLQQPTSNAAGAFVRRGDVVALLSRLEAEASDRESPRHRQERRLKRLTALGAAMEPHGAGWHVTGTRGALMTLAREEAEAGRAMSDRKNVREDLIEATKLHRGS